MNVRPELQQIIAQARQEMPQLAELPDEQVAQLIMQATVEQRTNTPTSERNLERMSTIRIRPICQHLN